MILYPLLDREVLKNFVSIMVFRYFSYIGSFIRQVHHPTSLQSAKRDHPSG